MTAASGSLGHNRPLHVIMTKVGLDGHDRGVQVVARAFRDAGMAVVYAGLRRTPDEIAEMVAAQDADVLGLSILSGSVVPLTRRVLAALKQRGIEDVLVLVGGIVPPEARADLTAMGVAGVFGPGASLAEIIGFVEANAPRGRGLVEQN